MPQSRFFKDSRFTTNSGFGKLDPKQHSNVPDDPADDQDRFLMQTPRSSEELRQISEKLRQESAELRRHAARLSAASNSLKREAQEVRERLSRWPAATQVSPVALRSGLGYSDGVLNSLEEA